MKQIRLHKNRYVDSVTLMSVGDRVLKLGGVENAEAQMATPANTELLRGLGYSVPADASADDLIFAVTASGEKQAEEAFRLMEDVLSHRLPAEEETVCRSLDEIDLERDPYDLAQISLPGEFVFPQAEKALEKGLDLFIFSDNVPLSEERALKEKGIAAGRLVMGPDCGVAFVNGVCLGAGSILRGGNVGIAAASGSGAQEVACLLERCGLGISQLIGTGGRDLTPEIGGLSMLDGIERLDRDPETKIIVLVSKLADAGVMEKVLCRADSARKPVTAVFLGAEPALFRGRRVIPAFTLEEAALKTAAAMGKLAPDFLLPQEAVESWAEGELRRYRPEQRYFRGLYCGGTFTEEGLIYFSKHCPEAEIHSNLENAYARKLADHHLSVGHTILDMGAEDFTAEAPHPVFDPSLRVKRLRQELKDPAVAAVLLDFITGPGVAEDPFTSAAEAVREAAEETGRHVTVIANICGSAEDPQNIAEKEKLLRGAGVTVAADSGESARMAAALMNALERAGGKA